MKELRRKRRDAGKTERAGIVFLCLLVAAFCIYMVTEVWQGYLILIVGVGATVVVGLLALLAVRVGWSVVYGAVKGVLNEVRNLPKDFRE